jgi:AAA15 family ATPase/GTPase
MLISFGVENFKSFGEKTEILMLPSKIQENQQHVAPDNGVAPAVLRAGLIYGHNASGKTNLIDAINYARQIVLNKSSLKEGDLFGIPQSKFTINDVTSFNFIIRINNKAYDYSFKLNKEQVLEEKLFEVEKWATLNKNRKKNPLFVREGVTVTTTCPPDSSPDFKTFMETRSVRKNQLFLNKLIDDGLRNFKKTGLGAVPFLSVYDWFSRMKIIYPDNPLGGWSRMEHDRRFAEFANNFLSNTDTGITCISIREKKFADDTFAQIYTNLKEGQTQPLFYDRRKYVQRKDGELYVKELCSEHNGQIFTMAEESRGTLRILDLIPLLFMASEKNFSDSLFLIDEMDMALHSTMSKNILFTFLNSSEMQNSSQLIATTHESALLESGRFSDDNKGVRKDELWYVFKKKNGNSMLIPLNKTQRIDKVLDKDFTSGELDRELRKLFE